MKETPKQIISMMVTLSLLLDPLGSRIFTQQHLHLNLNKPPSSNTEQKTQISDSPQERELMLKQKFIQPIEVEFRPANLNTIKSEVYRPQSHYFYPNQIPKNIGRELRELNKEENLLQLAKSIRKEAKENKLKIKRVYFGDNVSKSLKEKRLGSKLSNLLSSKSIKSRMRKLRKKIKKAAQNTIKRMNKTKTQTPKTKDNAELQLARKLATSLSGSSSGGSSSKKGDDEMAFNFLPGYAGMPFPPFMMNGPHYHPPLNVTVNALPHPNVRAMEHPSALKEENLLEDQEIVGDIISKLSEVDSLLSSATSDTNVDLQGKYEQVLMNF
jgi:hypothetical protein